MRGAELGNAGRDAADDRGRARTGQACDRDRDHFAGGTPHEDVRIGAAFDDLGDRGERDRAGRAGGDRDATDRVEVGRLRVDHDRQRLVLVEHAARGDELVGRGQLRGELARRDVQRGQLRRIDQDLDFAHAATLELDAADTDDAYERGPYDALRDLAQSRRFDVRTLRRRQVERDHGHRRRQHALDTGRRAVRHLDLIDRAAARVLDLQRIGLVGELQRQLGRTADRSRTHVMHAGHHGERFFERPRDTRLDELWRELAGVRDHDDTRKRHLRIDAARQREDRHRAEHRKRDRREPHDRTIGAQPADHHSGLATAGSGFGFAFASAGFASAGTSG